MGQTDTIKAYDFIYDLEGLEDDLTTTRCYSMYEFYKVLKGKKTFKQENIVPDIGRKYLVYSGLSDRYYLRTLNKEKEIEELEPDIEMNAVHLIWNKKEQAEVKEIMADMYRHYKKKEGVFSYYKQYIPLIESTLLYASHRDNEKDSMGFYTICKQYEEERLKLLNLK